ncbi:MAG: hypothetical protein ACXITR_08870 [Cyanobacterium sp.]
MNTQNISILATISFGFMCLSANAQVNLHSGTSQVKISGNGAMKIVTPNTVINFGEDSLSSTQTQSNNDDGDRYIRRSRFSDSYYTSTESNIIRIRGSNQRVEQRIFSGSQ